MADDIFENEIRQFLFDEITGDQETPELVLLTGQTGAGRSRAIGRLLSESPEFVVLSAASLRPFLLDGQGGEEIRGWMRDALTYARDHRVSVVLEDSFQSAQDARAALDLFNAAGFRTRIVALAVSLPESLLAAVARTVRQGPLARRPRGAVRADVELGIRTQHELLSLPLTDSAVTIVRRDGAFDQPNADPAGTWQEATTEPMPTRVAAEWISELRRLTDESVEESVGAQNTILDTLVDLHRMAINDVVPALALPANSASRGQLDARLKRDLVMLESLASRLSSPVGRPDRGPEVENRTASRGP